jgi:3-oxoacyl-[acyl-carrier protein] reductase
LRLKDKVAVITGGSRGIGRAMAVRFAAEGALIVLTYSHNEEAARETVALIKKEGGSAMALQGDVGNRADCQELADKTIAKFNKIDILINNAGITRDNIVARMKPEEWQQVIDTNLTGCFNCTQAFMRPFIKQKSGGTIINIASVVGVAGAAGQANYAAAKAGIIGFTKSLARELAGRQITVNAIAPGFVATEMTAALSEKQREGILALIPLGRVADPAEIAAAACFLASEGRYITGQVLCVDGGLII